MEPSNPAARSVAALLAALEEISRGCPDRVLRLRGQLLVDGEGTPIEGTSAAGSSGSDAEAATGTGQPFELLIFRGFSSSVTHPTAFDPDRPALPEEAVIETAELLAGPLNPLNEQRLAGPQPVEAFLSPTTW